jgi:hypothetical protein
VGVKIKQGNLESFDPVTPEIYQLHPATIHSKRITRNHKSIPTLIAKTWNQELDSMLAPER